MISRPDRAQRVIPELHSPCLGRAVYACDYGAQLPEAGGSSLRPIVHVPFPLSHRICTCSVSFGGDENVLG